MEFEFEKVILSISNVKLDIGCKQNTIVMYSVIGDYQIDKNIEKIFERRWSKR